MTKCEECKKIAMRVFGWTLGFQLNTLLQGGAIVLVGEGPKGGDIEVHITDEWLDVNHCSQFGIDEEKAQGALIHVKRCECGGCVSARGFQEKLLRLSKKEDGPFWFDALLIRIAVEKTGPAKKFTFSRKNMDPSSEIDNMIKAFDLFIGDNKELWIWSDAK